MVGEGYASYYFATLAMTGTFPPSNGGDLATNSTYLLCILCLVRHTLAIEPITLANALSPADTQDGTADMACVLAVGVRFNARARLNVSIYFWDVGIRCGKLL